MYSKKEKKRLWLKIIAVLIVVFFISIAFMDFTPAVQHIEKTIPYENN
ncbi:MAG: hypothetical protein LBU87_06645 [Lactobacillales bacterium]|jgi:cytochrome c-type biogenesis protein CcmE|nr:hypothetical protein [Lactobacillales bacterium]